jgi:ribosomal protein L37AE/L43A
MSTTGIKTIRQKKNKEKICRKCGLALTNNNWWVSRKNAGDYICDICYKNQQKVRYANNVNKRRSAARKDYHKNKIKFENRRLMRLFNISLEQYNEMNKEQGGVCAICGNSFAGGNQYGKVKLHVDHNHITNKVRGLLCYRCNTATGSLLVDSMGIELLCSAISYLRNTDNV